MRFGHGKKKKGPCDALRISSSLDETFLRHRKRAVVARNDVVQHTNVDERQRSFNDCVSASSALLGRQTLLDGCGAGSPPQRS
jgi:hypothetical protein